MIGTSTYAQANLTLVDYNIIGGIIACGVFLLLIALIGLLGTGLHHQVTLFVVSFEEVMFFCVLFRDPNHGFHAFTDHQSDLCILEDLATGSCSLM